MDRSNQSRRPFGYIISSDNHQNLTNYQNNPNLISPTPTDPGHLNTPFSSNGITPSHSPISVKDYPIIKRIAPQQACFKIDSYYRKPNDNYIKTIPKTERQKSRRQRIAQLDDAIFELEQMYAKLKLSDQDLLDRADRREVQLVRFNSASQIPAVSSPTQLVKSDEELINQQRTNRLNSNNELNKRRPISAFYNQFQRAVPLRRSGVPDLVGDDQAVRRLNSPLPPKNPVTITPSYLQTTPAYAKPLNMQHQKKKNIYGHLEFDPIVDDLNYRKMSQNQTNLAPHAPMGIPLNSTIIKTNPINDYLHSTKTNDMAVRSLRKDYSVNQTNPFAHVLQRSSSQSFFQQHHDENELLPETTTNYLINVKKQLKPTRSAMSFDESQQVDDAQDGIESHYFEPKRNPFLKSSSFSNSLMNQRAEDEQNLKSNPKKPKNNIYKKQNSLSSRNDTEEQLENMLSNLNRIPKITSPDLVSTNKYGIMNRTSDQINRVSNVDLINRESSKKSLARTEQSQSQSNLPTTTTNQSKQSNLNKKSEQPIRQDERRFGLIKSPTELINQSPRQHKVLLKSHTQGDLMNKYDEIEQNLKPRFGQRVVKSDVQRDHNQNNCQINEFKQSREPANELKWPKKKSETNQVDQWSTINQQVNQSNQLNKTNQINEPNTQSTSSQLNTSSQILNSSSSKKPNRQKNFFNKSSSIDQPSIGPNVPYVPYYYLPKKSNTQVDKMKNLFESKFNEGLYNVPNRRYNSKSSFATKPKKSSTQPNLMMNYKLNDSLDKKKKKLRKLKSSHALLNRSLHFSSKSNPSSEDENFSQFTDESEHETSSSSYDS